MAFEWGGTSDPLYEGTNLINSYPDIILVIINYRIGILGYRHIKSKLCIRMDI